MRRPSKGPARDAGGASARVVAALLLLAAAAALPTAARAQPPIPLIPSGTSLWARPLGIAIEGPLAFVGMTEGLVLYDLTNPFEPREVASILCPDSALTAFAYEDSVAYLSMGTAGVALVRQAGFDSLAAGLSIPPHFRFITAATGRDGVFYVLEPDTLFTYEDDGVGGVDVRSARKIPSGMTQAVLADSSLLLAGDRGLYRYRLDALGTPAGFDTLLAADSVVSAAGSDTLVVAVVRSGEAVVLRRAADGEFSESSRSGIPGTPHSVAIDSIYVAVSSDSGFAIFRLDEEDSLVLFQEQWDGERGGGPLAFRGRTLCIARTTEAIVDRIEVHSLLQPFEFTLVDGDAPGSDVIDFALAEGNLYVVSGDSGIYRYDAEPPPRIGERRLVARIDSIQAVAASDSLVVIARLDETDAGAGIRVFARSPDDSLLLRANFAIGGNPVGLAIRDTLLAVAGGGAGVPLLSLARPNTPYRIGAYDPLIPAFACQKVLFADARHVCAMNVISRAIHVVDVTNPDLPTRVSLLQFSSLKDFAVDPATARLTVLDTLGVVTLFDLSDPALPVALDTLAVAGPPGEALAIGNGFVVVGAGGAGFTRLAIEGGTTLTPLGISQTVGELARIRIGAGATYTLSPPTGVEVFAFSGANELDLRGEQEVSANVVVVTTKDSLVVVGDALGTLSVLKLRPGGEVELLNSERFADRIRASIFLSGDSLLALVSGDSLLTLAVGEDGGISRVGAYLISRNVTINAIAVFGSYVVVPIGGGNVYLVDVANPAAPYQYVSFTALGNSGITRAGNIRAVQVVDKTLFVVFRGAPELSPPTPPRVVVAWDLTNPQQPQYLGYFDGGTDGEYLSAVATPSFLYLAAGADGIRIVNIADPAAMSQVPFESPVENTEGLTIVGDFLVSANGTSGISAFDLVVSEANPPIVAAADTPGRSRDVASLPNTVIVADTYALLTYSTNLVVDDVIPPDFAIGLVTNPFVTSYADLYVIPTEAITGVPEVRFVIADLDVLLSVGLIDPSQRVFHTALRLDRVGSGQISANGVDVRGNSGLATKDVFLTLLRGADGGTISIDDSTFAASFSPGAAPPEARVIALAESPGDLLAFRRQRPPPESAPKGYRLSILPGDDAPLSVSIRPPDGAAAPEEWQVYRLAEGGWTPLPSVLRGGRVVAESAGGGLFWLARGVSSAPAAAALLPNVPNPFNPTTTIRYDVPAPGGRVDVAIYAPDGRLVRRLAGGAEPAGRKQRVWDGTDDGGSPTASGVYLLRYEFEGQTASRKLHLLR